MNNTFLGMGGKAPVVEDEPDCRCALCDTPGYKNEMVYDEYMGERFCNECYGRVDRGE